jgi:peptidoglycan/LPS O-acetylase OafA/YrhL
MGKDTPNRFFLPELDGLRFVAFLCVYMFHAAKQLPTSTFSFLRELTKIGEYGVDLFFLLSAFLITQLLLRERELRGELHVGFFWLRRICRIWPLYFHFLALGIAFGYLGQPRLDWRYLIAFGSLSGNWICVLYGLPQSIIFPLWSVSVEEQFYLLWPLVVRRAHERIIVLLALALLLVGIVTRATLCHALGDGAGYATFVRVDAFAVGILLAVIFKERRLSLCRGQRLLLFLGGFAAWMMTSLFAEGAHRWNYGYPFVVVGAACMLLSVLGSSNDGIALSTNERLSYLGRISYGLYVFHILAQQLAYAFTASYIKTWVGFLAFVGIGLVATIVLASLSFAAIEKPFLRLKERFSFVPSGH